MSNLLIQTTQPTETSSPIRITSHRSEKIADHHLQRLAIVYVRQSTQQQVLEHRESTARQYALTDRAIALGWPSVAVEIIDEDQGRSGSSAEGRSGFQRLLAEVSADRVTGALASPCRLRGEHSPLPAALRVARESLSRRSMSARCSSNDLPAYLDWACPLRVSSQPRRFLPFRGCGDACRRHRTWQPPEESSRMRICVVIGQWT